MAAIYFKDLFEQTSSKAFPEIRKKE